MQKWTHRAQMLKDSASIVSTALGPEATTALMKDAATCALAAAISPMGLKCAACRNVASSTKKIIAQQLVSKVEQSAKQLPHGDALLQSMQVVQKIVSSTSSSSFERHCFTNCLPDRNSLIRCNQIRCLPLTHLALA
jgi:hypothetical protein